MLASAAMVSIASLACDTSCLRYNDTSLKIGEIDAMPTRDQAWSSTSQNFMKFGHKLKMYFNAKHLIHNDRIEDTMAP